MQAQAALTEYHYNPLIGARQRLENGYVVGRDAGRVIVATQSAQLQGDIETATFQGDRQINARQADLDGYLQAQRDFWIAKADLDMALLGAPSLSSSTPAMAATDEPAGH